MRFSKNCLTFFILQSVLVLPKAAFGQVSLTKEVMDSKVGDGSANQVTFTSSYLTNQGTSCTTCSFCNGSKLNFLFDPKASSFCINCDTSGSCDRIRVVTSSKTPWTMNRISLSSSAMLASYDPSKVVIEGLNGAVGSSGATWIKLFELDSGTAFSSRSTKMDYTFVNNQKFEHYAVTLIRKPGSPKISIGHYNFVESYLKQLTCTLNEDLTGAKVQGCEAITTSPTHVPTYEPTYEPTKKPTKSPYPALTQGNIQPAVDYWFSNRALALSTYGHISSWDVSQVTSMRQLFYRQSTFNDDISAWDVRNVVDMQEMFRECSSFNGNLSSWNVSKVFNMWGTFELCPKFNGDVSSWNVSSVRSMESMFSRSGFNGDLSKWDVRNVVNMLALFYGSPFNNNVSTWNVEKVTNMDLTFTWATFFNGDISKWNVSRVTTMYKMFEGAAMFNSDISGWNVGKVTYMGGLFSKTKFNGNISAWDVSNVTNMDCMFYQCSFNNDLSTWNVGRVNTMVSMFRYHETFNGDLSKWNVSSVTNMAQMFFGSLKYNGDLSRWNVSNVKNILEMFKESPFNGDISAWNIGRVTDMRNMFLDDKSFNRKLCWTPQAGCLTTNMFQGCPGGSLGC